MKKSLEDRNKLLAHSERQKRNAQHDNEREKLLDDGSEKEKQQRETHVTMMEGIKRISSQLETDEAQKRRNREIHRVEQEQLKLKSELEAATEKAKQLRNDHEIEIQRLEDEVQDLKALQKADRNDDGKAHDAKALNAKNGSSAGKSLEDSLNLTKEWLENFLVDNEMRPTAYNYSETMDQNVSEMRPFTFSGLHEFSTIRNARCKYEEIKRFHWRAAFAE